MKKSGGMRVIGSEADKESSDSRRKVTGGNGIESNCWGQGEVVGWVTG